VVIGLSASDADVSWPNNAVTYMIEYGSRDDFVIDSATGLVTVSASAWWLAGSRSRALPVYTYQLTVAASDRGSPPLSSVCQLNISILTADDDVTAGAPVFHTSDGHRGLTLVMSVSEDAPVGHVIYTVRAVYAAGADRLRFHWLSDSTRGYDVRGRLVDHQNYLQVSSSTMYASVCCTAVYTIYPVY